LQPEQLGPVMLENSEQLLVVDIPKGSPRLVLPKEAKVRKQLP
jgi:hypothetical protein